MDQSPNAIERLLKIMDAHAKHQEWLDEQQKSRDRLKKRGLGS